TNDEKSAPALALPLPPPVAGEGPIASAHGDAGGSCVPAGGAPPPVPPPAPMSAGTPTRREPSAAPPPSVTPSRVGSTQTNELMEPSAALVAGGLLIVAAASAGGPASVMPLPQPRESIRSKMPPGPNASTRPGLALPGFPVFWSMSAALPEPRSD